MTEAILHMIFIPKYRIYAAYCEDVHIRIYMDHNNGFKQINQVLCSYTIHWLVCQLYNGVENVLNSIFFLQI